MDYDGLQIFQKHLQRKSEAEEFDSKVINPKLKQFYEVETKIEPFYTGGKVVPLPGSRFVCQCGPAVKLVSTAETPIVKLEIDAETQGEEPDTTTPPLKHGSFGILGTLQCEMDEIISFDACSSSNTLITSHKSQLLRLWNLHSQEVTRTVKSFHTVPIRYTEIYKVNVSDVKQELCVTGQPMFHPFTNADELTWATVAGNSVKVWNTGGSQVSKVIRIDGIAAIGFVKWETKKQRLFVAERSIYCIEEQGVGSGQYIISQTLTGHYSQVTGLEWGDGDIMVSSGRDKTIIIWNTGLSQIEKLKSLAFPGVIESTVLHNKTNLYIASLAGVIRHMDLESLTLSSEESLVSKDGDETILTLHPPLYQGLDTEANNFFVSNHLCTLYQVVRSKMKKKVGKFKLNISNQFVGSLDEVLDVTLWGNTHVAVANNTNVIKVYDLNSGSCQFLRGHKDIVLSVSSQQDYLVSGSKDNTIIFWKSGQNDPHKILEGHLASVTAVCFNPTKLQIYSVSEDNFLKTWSMERCLKSTAAHENEIHAVHCSPNGTLVATASRDKTCKIWDAESLKLRGVLKGHKKSVWDVHFSSWDQLTVTSSADTTLKIWNVATYECIKTLQGHQSSVLKGKFINLGLQIISTGSDGTIRTWDLRNSQCLTVLENSDDKVWALDSTPDGSFVVTGSADSILTIWRDITEQKVKDSLSKRKILFETEQKLQNVIESGKWASAIQLAIQLDRPFALLRVIRDIPKEESDVLPEIIGKLPMDDKISLLHYIEKWNTNTRTSTEAQTLLYMILKSTPPKNLNHMKISSLLPYTEKHFKRLLKLQQEVCIVKFLSQEKRFIEKESEEIIGPDMVKPETIIEIS